MTRHLVPSLSLALFGCIADPLDFGEDKGLIGTDETGDTHDTETGDADTDTDTDTDTDSDSDTETGSGDEYSFDDPGDWGAFSADESPANLRLADASGDVNQGQQFYLVLVNAESDGQGYGLRYTLDAAPGPDAPRSVAVVPRGSLSSPRAVGEHVQPPAPHHRDALSSDDIGTTIDTFRVRVDVEDSSLYTVKDATLWALGDHVAIWVDNEVPIDWDKECDGIIDVEHPYDTYGFDNCDLNLVADITDLNIVPNVTSMFGDLSDIDGDGRIDVFISPELNNLPTTSETESYQLRVLPSYAEPAVDLEPYDLRTNPGSDQREVIYAYAPDPYGYYNNNAPVAIDDYTSYALAGEIARSLVTLVSYNQHIIVAGGSTIESDWVNDVFGTLAADRCGFGSAFHNDAWLYLDSTHLQPLAGDGTKGSLDPQARGAQYMFGLWLWDYVSEHATDADAVWMGVFANDKTETDSIEYGLDQGGISIDSFPELVLEWQLAMVTSEVTLDDGSTMALDEVVPYSGPELLSSPPALRDNLYGANGFQRGLSLQGSNWAYTGGETDAPVVQLSSEVRIANVDYYHFDPAFDFEGYIKGGYASQVVRLDGIPYDAADLEIQFEGAGFTAAGIRWNDPTGDYAIENIFSPTDVNSVALPDLATHDGFVTGLGEVTGPSSVTVVDSEGVETSEDVDDTDRWLLDLTDYRPGSKFINIWLERRLNTEGDTPLDDPWIAIVPVDYVPEPTVAGTHTADSCSGAPEFEYPTSVLDYLYYQVFLSSAMGSVSEFDGCGSLSETLLTCGEDFDLDGVADSDEPQPSNLLEQVLVQQCTALGGFVPDGDEYSTDNLDLDEIDEDDGFTYSASTNSGGASGAENEEGYINAIVEGGQKYLIIVGGNGDEGVYELSVRMLE